MARVLLIAYSCEPYASSEGAVGWQLASRLARRHSVHLIARPKARSDIEEQLATDPTLDMTVEFHELPVLQRAKAWGLPVSNLRYLIWNHRLAKRVRELESGFDVVHHVTWVRYWMGSAAAGARATPIVWGPVGAAERPPLSLLGGLGVRGAAAEGVRWLGPIIMRLDPLVRRMMRATRQAVASSVETQAELARRGVPVLLGPSVGFDSEAIPADSVGVRNQDLISVGRLLPWKGFHLGIEAFARMAPDDARYVIVGSGPFEGRLRKLAERLGVADRVEFTGRLEPDAVQTAIASSAVLVHPSLHDSGGFVVVEALAHGVPVVCLDIGGPAFLSGPAGIAVSPKPTRTVVERLAVSIADARKRGAELGAIARTRAEDVLDWERIVDRYGEIYDGLAGAAGGSIPPRK